MLVLNTTSPRASPVRAGGDAAVPGAVFECENCVHSCCVDLREVGTGAWQEIVARDSHTIYRFLDTARGALRQYRPVLPNSRAPPPATGFPSTSGGFRGSSRLAADYAFDYRRASPTSSPAIPRIRRRGATPSRARSGIRASATPSPTSSQRSSAARRAAERRRRRRQLRDPQTVAVVTGQQAGLFGGPLFTLLKAITAIRLAERVRDEHHVPAVAVFWIDAEDHDWDEVRSCTRARRRAPGRARVALPASPGSRDARWAASRSTTVDGRARRPDSRAARHRVHARAARRPRARLSRRARAWRRRSAAGSKRCSGPRAWSSTTRPTPPPSRWSPTSSRARSSRRGATARRAIEAGAALEARGYHAQVDAARRAAWRCFASSDGREPIRVDGDTAVIGDDARSRSPSWRRAPGPRRRSSAPTCCCGRSCRTRSFPRSATSAGPNELAYLAQLEGVYAAFGVPMPLVAAARHRRRCSTPTRMRFLTRHDVPLESLRAQDESVLNDLLEAAAAAGRRGVARRAPCRRSTSGWRR